MYEIVAVIPARGGSKRVPEKNVARVGGKPLIQWTIAAALQARLITRVVVSTDNPQIAAIAQAAGAEVPFLRPAELARDDTPGIAPILHAIDWFAQAEAYYPDAVMCLQPTSPLRTAADIDGAITLARQQNADAVVSGVAAAQHPYWMKQCDSAGRIRPFLEQDAIPVRRQDLPAVYALNGAIYLARRELLVEQKTWYTDQTYLYVMPEERSLDLDTPWDLHLADLVLTARHVDATV
jgi:CMP-N-acetylneuraminic acid synthetase